jgi:hypothetical protein
MGLVNTLLQRRGSLAGVLVDRPDVVVSSGAPPETKRWRCWMHAELSRQEGDLGRCLRWLRAAELVPAPDDVVWLAEHETTAGKALAADGETGRALAHLERAFASWQSLHHVMGGSAGPEATQQLMESVVALGALLLEDERTESATDSQELIIEWFRDRVVPETLASGRQLLVVCGSLGSRELGERTGAALLAWLPDVIGEGYRPIMEARVRLDLGNFEQALDDDEAAAAEFTAGIDALAPVRGDPEAEGWVQKLEFNRANALLRLGEVDEAIAVYEATIEGFRRSGEREAELRSRYALLFARRRGRSEDVFDELRELVADYEQLGRDGDDRALLKQVLEPAYRLLLTLLAERPLDEDGLEEIFGLVAALRDERLLAGLHELEQTGARAPAFLRRPLQLLDRRLARLPHTALLVWEAGVDCIVHVCLASGRGALHDRVVVATGGPELAAAAEALTGAANRAADELSARAADAGTLSDDAVAAAGVALAEAMPAAVLGALQEARTVLFSPSSGADAVPLEFLRTEDGYLGVARVVARTPSLRHLLEGLAPNRSNRVPQAVALVVRADDPPDLDPLPAADADAKLVANAAGALGIQPLELRGPVAEQLLEELDRGARVFHYVGHGMASGAGEVLHLSDEQELPAAALSALRYRRAPFTYLSACLVGRARHLVGGRQKGFGVALLDAGAPAVVAATYSVPDSICADVSEEFYAAAWQQPVGEAMRAAREVLHDRGFHPVAWGSFVVQGDPSTAIAASLPWDASRRATLDWPSHLTRYLATGSAAYREACETALETARADLPEQAAVLAQVVAGLEDGAEATAGGAAEAVVERLAAFDVEGAAALSLLLAERRLSSDGEAEIDPDAVRQTVGRALATALALDDSYGFLLFANHHARLMAWMPEALAVAREALTRADALETDSELIAPLVDGVRLLPDAAERGAILLDAPGMLGIDPALFEAADSGDEEALKAIDSKVLADMGSPGALTDGEWRAWLLRYLAAGTEQALADTMASIRAARERRALPESVAEAVWALLEDYRGPGAADPQLYEAALAGLEDERDATAIEAFRCWDAIATVGAPDDANVELGYELAERLGHPGALARFGLLRAQLAYEAGDPRAAAAESLTAIDRLLEVRADREYDELFRAAATNGRSFALMAGDQDAAAAFALALAAAP